MGIPAVSQQPRQIKIKIIGTYSIPIARLPLYNVTKQINELTKSFL